MVRKMRLPALFLPAAMILLLHSQDRGPDSHREVRKESIRKTLVPVSATRAPELVIDNMEGSITVDAYEGREIQVEIAKTIRARTADEVARAEAEVELKITEKDYRSELYVDGPFRCNDGSRRNRQLGYRVIYDFQVRVPRNCDLVLRTVNEGDVRVTGVQGTFDVSNVNGAVRLASIAGAGSARTVNGGVDVSFSRNPTAGCSFRTVNGNLDVSLRPELSADLWFETFNGGAYTDYEVTPLPPPAPGRDKAGGKYVYKTGRSFGVRAGKGGPRMAFDTLNGDILVKSK
jgi:hypothetical protein